MVYYSRALVSGRQKLALSIALIIGAIFVVMNQRVMEAALAFFFGGIVPGTDIVIAADVFLAGVIILFVLLLAGTILRMKLRATRRRREIRIPVRVVAEKHIPVMEALEDASPIYVEPSIPKIPRRTKHTFFLVTVLRALRDAAGVILIGIGRGVSAVYRVSSALVRLTGIGIQKLCVGLYVIAAAIMIAVYRISLMAGRSLARAAVGGARRTAPYLKKFDEWLELQVRKFESWFRRTVRKYESAQLVRDVLSQSKKSAAAVQPSPALRSLRKKIPTVKH